MDTESIIMSFSYVGIFALMIANGSISFPSSQILYILVGYFVGTGYLALLPASLAGALGNTIGNIMLYEAVRAKGMDAIKKFGIFREADIRKVEMVFKKKGLWFLFVGKLLPAIKVFIPIPAGLGQVDRRTFASIMFTASWLWSFIFIAIGYFFGKGAGMWKSYGVILMAVAALVVFLFYRYMNSPAIIKELGGEASEKPSATNDK
jgi:membrane protein DedA with SNARE-associated domain